MVTKILLNTKKYITLVDHTIKSLFLTKKLFGVFSKFKHENNSFFNLVRNTL